MNNVFAALVVVSLAGACNKPAPATTEQVPVAAQKAQGSPTPYAIGATTHCAVTGEEFNVTASTVQVQHNGKYYAFCCPGCKPKFEKNPNQYAQN